MQARNFSIVYKKYGWNGEESVSKVALKDGSIIPKTGMDINISNSPFAIVVVASLLMELLTFHSNLSVYKILQTIEIRSFVVYESKIIFFVSTMLKLSGNFSSHKYKELVPLSLDFCKQLGYCEIIKHTMLNLNKNDIHHFTSFSQLG